MSNSSQLLKDKASMEAWLQAHRIDNYTLRPHTEYGYVVDVEGEVRLGHRKLGFLPIRFGNITDNLDIQNNNLLSIDCAENVGNSLFAQNNHFENLIGCPQIKNNLYVQNNMLTSLEGCPEKINGNFYCAYNLLESLKYCAKVVGAILDCSHNNLTSLEYAPNHIGYYMRAHDNEININKLSHLPAYVKKFIMFDTQKSHTFEEAQVLHNRYLIEAEKERLEQTVLPVLGHKTTHKI